MATGVERAMRVLAIVIVAALASAAYAGPIPPGFTVAKASISPDGKLGVLVPDAKHTKPYEHQNKLVELATGKVIAVLRSDTVFVDQSHAAIKPQWSADGALLIWYVDGKWGSFAVVAIALEHGAVKWQTDVREVCVIEALRAARAANPTAYAAAKAHGKSDGSWYRDGLSIDVRPAGTAKLPLAVAITLTSNPKNLDDFPAAAKLAGSLTATLASDGKLTFGKPDVK